MVVDHCDLPLENIIILGCSIAAIIDWEFTEIELEFVDVLFLNAG